MCWLPAARPGPEVLQQMQKCLVRFAALDFLKADALVTFK
jgi:hypothetical protein